LLPFEPFFKNGHLATVAGNFWSRPESEHRWPVQAVRYQSEPGVEVLVHAQYPDGQPIGELILVHGLEGSSEAGYARSLAAAALEAGYSVHRFNMRGCGGSEWNPRANYHSGQTSDLLFVIRERKRLSSAPIYPIGFSLGGNVVLKLAGELGDSAQGLIAGVGAVCTPIDLAVAVAQIDRLRNFIFERRFLSRLKERVRRRHRVAPELYSLEHLSKVRTIYDFDEYYTAKLFGFGSADDYYRSQSSNQFLEKIRVPALVVHAQDDPLIPVSMYRHPAFGENPYLHLVTVEHGGHLGFISRHPPRFWLDGLLLEWLARKGCGDTLITSQVTLPPRSVLRAVTRRRNGTVAGNTFQTLPNRGTLSPRNSYPRRRLKRGTDYSVPSRELLTSRACAGVARAVCPLFQQVLERYRSRFASKDTRRVGRGIGKDPCNRKHHFLNPRPWRSTRCGRASSAVF